MIRLLSKKIDNLQEICSINKRNNVFSIYLNIICLLLIVFSCKNEVTFKDKFTLVPTNENIRINIGSRSKNFSSHIQFFNADNVNYLAVLNRNNNSIEFYNLDKESFCRYTQIQLEGSNSFGTVQSFLINNFDSIIIITIYPRKIGIIDTCGNILRTIFYEKDINNNITMASLPTGGLRPYRLGNTIFLSQFYQAIESNGILTEGGQKKSYVALTLDLHTEQCTLLPLTYPKELIGTEVSAMPILRVLGYKDNFLYYFRNLDSFYTTEDYVEFNNLPIEINYKLNVLRGSNYMTPLSDAINIERTHDNILNMYYDKYRECYYIVIKKRNSDSANKSSFGTNFYPECFILILDKKLKYLGESYFQANTYSFQMCFITEKGLYISEDNIENPEFSEDLMRFRLFTLEKI
jgi:hypothetical protein